MNPYNIANPPVGIYRGDLPISYAYINVLNDIHARHLQKQGFKVNCPLYSFNSLGKRAESLGLDGTIEGLRDYYQRWRSRCNLRHRLGLIFEGEIADCSEQSIFHAQNVLVELSERGFVEKRGDETYLDITRIKSRFPCEKLAESIEFYPQRARTEFLRMVRESGSPIRVSKDRVYSARNPLGGSSISPIFVVSNMWDAYFKDGVDCISCSEKELARYILLRFYSRVPLSEVLPMKKVFVPNLIQPEGGYDSWDVSDCTRDEVSSDALRYAISKSLSQNKQSMIMKKSALQGGVKLIHLVGNINKFFNKNIDYSDIDLSKIRYNPSENMPQFKFSAEISELEVFFRTLSKSIREYREGDSGHSPKEMLESYVNALHRFEPFCPFICNKVFKGMSLEKLV